jgi:glycosyltransferase involved in cell wall biosynthesis
LGDTLKVLFITAWYPTADNPINGIFIREHAKSVSMYGNEVVVIYAGRAENRSKRIYKVLDAIEDGIRTIRIYCFPSPFRPINYILYSWAALVIARRLFRKGFIPEIIHAHVYTAGLPALILGRLYKIPIIISEHWTKFPRRKLNPFEKILAKFVMNRVDMILPVSNSLKVTLCGYGIKGRFEIVPNVVDTSLFYPSEKHRKKNHEKRILFVGSLKPIKGLPELFDALSKLGQRRIDWHLDIVGEGPARKEYEQRVTSLGLNHKIKFHGLRTKREVAEFMRQADFFVLPSLFETFSVVTAEALATGTPVLATISGGPEEFVTDEVGLLIPPGNKEALSNGLDNMLDLCGKFKSEQISNYATEHFSLRRVGKKLNEIYIESIKKC